MISTSFAWFDYTKGKYSIVGEELTSTKGHWSASISVPPNSGSRKYYREKNSKMKGTSMVDRSAIQGSNFDTSINENSLASDKIV